MEAVRDFTACEVTACEVTACGDEGRGADPARQFRAGRAGGAGGVDGADGVDSLEGVDGVLAALQAVSARAVEDAASWGFRAASDFAGQVEEISRTVEYLQLVAAAAVDQARKQSVPAAAGAVTSWTTGWRDDAPGAAAGNWTGTGDGVSPAAAGTGDRVSPAATGDGASWGRPAGAADSLAAGDAPVAVDAAGAVDDGYRNTAEFLRARLRIGAAEARRRLSLAGGLLPRQGLAGRQVPAAHPELGAAVAAGEVASRAATVIAVALERARPLCAPDAVAGMEHALTRTAAENDADFLVRVARSWTDAMDQDGAEPSEELLRQLQGAFIRRRRHGLHHLEIFATTDQYEHLLTVMNAGANPRTGSPDTPPAADAAGGEGPAGGTAAVAAAVPESGSGAPGEGWAAGAAAGTAAGKELVTGPAAGEGSPFGAAAQVSACAVSAAGVSAGATAAGPDDQPAAEGQPDATEDRAAAAENDPAPAGDPGARGLDLRTRAQKLLDGLVGACKGTLAAGGVPASGGLRPQVMVTIDYRDLLTRLGTSPANGPADGPEPGPPARAPGQTGTLLFTGPVTASTARKIACDADIIPVLLGGDGRILDIGRASRIFPPHIRKALTARDRGCAFPGCTIPAPWCEAHHITYWSHGGATSTENGTLLCSHHHHLIHKENWAIRLHTGIPWFIPPPHIDPRQQPRRNHYFHPANLTTAA